LSAYRIAVNKLRTTSVLTVRTQSSTVKTLTFEDRECAGAKPGQFLMLWIPGVDEIPLSILDVGENSTISVAVKRVGEATEALHRMKVGDFVGVRGPFGNSFSEKKGKILIVGGGTGMAPLWFLVKRLLPDAERLVFLMGAKTEDELLFMDRLKKTLTGKNRQLVATTEDGSCGITGLCTQPLEKLLIEERFDAVYTCGPELMIKEVLELAEKHGVHLEASLERFMRCAIGLCGSCVIGKYRVCRDGPVFTSKQLREMKAEFGISKRDFDGKRIPL
jgi:dihydroorotate dehydrogenase electron transfer subunit